MKMLPDINEDMSPDVSSDILRKEKKFKWMNEDMSPDPSLDTSWEASEELSILEIRFLVLSSMIIILSTKLDQWINFSKKNLWTPSKLTVCLVV